MDLYQHDSAAMFRFVLRGDLSGTFVREFEQAWNTATSIATQKEIVVDLSGVTDADAAGVELLCRMRESGVRLTAELPPRSDAFLRMGKAPAAPEAHYFGRWAVRLMQLWRALGVIGGLMPGRLGARRFAAKEK
ncbi:MAG TPA: STAS domain-containing protein [Candidatus Bathyarchaeia archaeon]|nr:STAS domain-containing protein [Candidatus Bathyarchaeia archaeon]HXK02088.1 STAS domain-containing protein [Verrucomicrobiae bacterium]